MCDMQRRKALERIDAVAAGLLPGLTSGPGKPNIAESFVLALCQRPTAKWSSCLWVTENLLRRPIAR